MDKVQEDSKRNALGDTRRSDAIAEETYGKTICQCGIGNYKICHKHKLIYCIICDSFYCPECEVEAIEIALNLKAGIENL